MCVASGKCQKFLNGQFCCLAMNMVTKSFILEECRLEFGITQLFFRCFNGFTGILDLKHFSMNLNENLHQ